MGSDLIALNSPNALTDEQIESYVKDYRERLVIRNEEVKRKIREIEEDYAQ